LIKALRYTLLFFGFWAGASFSNAHAQTVIDSTGIKIDSTTKKEAAIDTAMNVHSPHKASIRSAIIPGWGQVYNRSYWKLPIIYGALGTTAYIFFDNLKTYKEYRFAYAARYKAALPKFDPANPRPGPYQDSTDFKLLKPLYQNPRIDINQLKYQRDEFRRYIDYSVLVFVLFWGLNVVDAAVDAHLKTFDVSPDLGLRFKAGYSDLARTNGFSIVLTFK
jgi:hypothetical protein